MFLTIVILSFNTPELIKECVNSLVTNYEDEIKKDQLEILIVDNASESQNITSIQEFISNKKVRLILNKQNLGFGRGCNVGVKNARGKFVLFLNSDTLVEDKGLIKMAQFLQNNPHVGVIGGRLLNFDEKPQASSGKFYNLINFFVMLVGGQRLGLILSSPKRISKVDWVSGACMMVNKAIFKDVGGFDKNMFMYMEDVELCYRMLKQGYSTYFYPFVSVKHQGQGSSNRGFAIVNIYEGLLYFYKKHKSDFQFKIVRSSLKTKSRVAYLLGKFTRSSYLTKTYGETFKLFR